MDTSIYIGPVLQLLPRTVDVQGDALLSQKMEGISSQNLQTLINQKNI
jgi:hypothetical protein